MALSWWEQFRRQVFPKRTCLSHGCTYLVKPPAGPSNLCLVCRLEMTMSKQDYELIAREIAASYKKYNNEPALVDLALHLAGEFERTNDYFSRSRFLVACGMPLLA